MPFINMLYLPLAMENLTAYGAGQPLPNIVVKAAWSGYASLGGAGGTAGLCVLMFFLAKSQRYKTLGKLALPIGLCGINEPITFGVPMVMNTIMPVSYTHLDVYKRQFWCCLPNLYCVLM